MFPKSYLGVILPSYCQFGQLLALTGAGFLSKRHFCSHDIGTISLCAATFSFPHIMRVPNPQQQIFQRTEQTEAGEEREFKQNSHHRKEVTAQAFDISVEAVKDETVRISLSFFAPGGWVTTFHCLQASHSKTKQISVNPGKNQYFAFGRVREK